jgi:SEC-C motif
MLGELDTFYDFTAYITAKEAAIKKYEYIAYAGEEDLLAHYYCNFDEHANSHFIGTQDNSFNGILIPEGGWQAFIASEPYQRKKSADKDSYLWDELLQRTSQNALDGILLGDGGVFETQSAIFEMAKEPRFVRREFAKAMLRAIANFPDSEGMVTRNLSFMPSFYKTTGYVFLQLRYKGSEDYDTYYRPKRQAILEVACGVAKNKFPHLSKVVGIAIDAPKFAKTNSEDFALLKCDTWPEEQRRFYEERNRGFQFFESPSLKTEIKTVSNFPAPSKKTERPKIGRNELCPCGSGRKYKKCHGPLSVRR